MNEFATDLNGFKRRGKQFFDALPTFSLEELDNAFKAISLTYLQSDFQGMDQYQAVIVLNLATQHYLCREVDLENQLAAEER